MTETDLAYLAGMIDGEGTITIFEHEGRHRLILQVFNTDERVLLWMKETFGGRVHRVGRRERPGQKQEHTWATGWQHAASVLGACLPYLKIKRVQAELFIAHAATSTRSYGRAGTPIEVRQRRNQIVETIRALNRRGIAIIRNADGSPRV